LAGRVRDWLAARAFVVGIARYNVEGLAWRPAVDHRRRAVSRLEVFGMAACVVSQVLLTHGGQRGGTGLWIGGGDSKVDGTKTLILEQNASEYMEASEWQIYFCWFGAL
jgi:hypothetical protein